ncbi:hypothetical protein MHUMG1_09575 [Metarhizium humberi]|uniref:Uncharacterized protein n=1 Tax=Metarhizium humberi TaxID=2596975 RepID=A0A9P8M1X3_9HYPO|nr:hypothetical protein MHUMG1_09575 [Metarhizium humberi]
MKISYFTPTSTEIKVSGARYQLWRRLGDVISSTFALGYHEDLNGKADTPVFLLELRKAAFARIYSADKNVSLFLGRPLRMSKRFCHFQLPGDAAVRENHATATEQSGEYRWASDTEINYRAETRWSAICASLKEEIIELLFDRTGPDVIEKAGALQMSADAYWNALPARFKANEKLKDATRSAFERDFLISIRLNYLHIMFLLRRLILGRVSELDSSVVHVAQEMLGLVVDALVLRDELVNSGTNLAWKVAHYGLPAAGIVLLAIHGQGGAQNGTALYLPETRAKAIQNLCVLAAEVERGTVVRSEDPNFALLSRATQIIQRFLNHIFSGEGGNQTENLVPPGQADDASLWLPQHDQDPWNLELGIWQGFVGHPSLFGLYG